MQEENLDYEGVIDVGILVPSCFENPLKEESISFLEEALLGRKKTLIPVSAVIGAYHIVTNYLGVSRVSAKRTLSDLLRTRSQALYQEVGTDLAAAALDYAAIYGIESWDGYLIALARKFGAKIVFSLDEALGDNLKQRKEIGLPMVVNPFTTRRVSEYHRFLEGKKA
jgi:predicted nucleic acid-binding protein